MSNIKPIQINPELFKISSNSNKNKTLKNKNNPKLKPNLLKKDLLARIKSHRLNKINNLEETSSDNIDTNNQIIKENEAKKEPSDIPITVENNNNLISQKSNINNDDDFLQSIDFLKNLSRHKQTRRNKNYNNFPLEKQSDVPSYGCLKNGILPTFRDYHNNTFKNNQPNNVENIYKDNIIDKPDNNKNKRAVTFKYNLGKKHKVVSVLIKNASTRKKISCEHTRLKESKLNEMKNYLKRHNLIKSGSKSPPDVIKKMYEQSLLSGDIRNINKNSVVHNYLAE